MTDLVRRLRDVQDNWPLRDIELEAAERIEQLQEALRECTKIAEAHQDENMRLLMMPGSKLSQAKAKATAVRCGALLGELRKHVRAVMEKHHG